MVKIAARLIIRVATVIPERKGLRTRLSVASRTSAHEIPGRRTDDWEIVFPAKRMTRGAKNAMPSKKISMPTMPMLNWRTGPANSGADRIIAGARMKHTKPRRVDQDFLPPDTGRQA